MRHSVWYVLRMMKSDDFLVSRLSAGVTYPWEVLTHLYTFPPLFLLTVSLGLLRGVPLFRLPTYWAAYPSLLFPALFRTERRYSTCALLVFSCLVPLTHSLPPIVEIGLHKSMVSHWILGTSKVAVSQVEDCSDFASLPQPLCANSELHDDLYIFIIDLFRSCCCGGVWVFCPLSLRLT